MDAPRPWYQLYLSTLVILALLAAAVLGLNLQPTEYAGTQVANFSYDEPDLENIEGSAFSWRFFG